MLIISCLYLLLINSGRQALTPSASVGRAIAGRVVDIEPQVYGQITRANIGSMLEIDIYE